MSPETSSHRRTGSLPQLPARRPLVASRRETRRQFVQRWLLRLTWLNFAGVLVLALLLCVVSERWWLSAVLTYLPRAPYLVPSVLLACAALLFRPRIAWVNFVSGLIVLVPIMGFTAPVASPPAQGEGSTPLRLVSGNVQDGKGSLLRLVREIDRFQPDIVSLQETGSGVELLHEHFRGWDIVHLGPYFIASKHPVRVIDQCRAEAFDRWSAILVEIETPDGPIELCNIHLMTPRHGATGLTAASLLTGEGVDEFEWHQWQRTLEAEETRRFVDERSRRPLLVAGDFNAPSTSSMHTQFWSGFQNAFETAVIGYGYTSPCNTDRIWPSNTPWMRIDHILADDSWAIHEARIGQSDASDHRLMFAEVSLSTHQSPTDARAAIDGDRRGSTTSKARPASVGD